MISGLKSTGSNKLPRRKATRLYTPCVRLLASAISNALWLISMAVISAKGRFTANEMAIAPLPVPTSHLFI